MAHEYTIIVKGIYNPQLPYTKSKPALAKLINLTAVACMRTDNSQDLTKTSDRYIMDLAV